MEVARRVFKNTLFLYVRIAVNIVVSLYSTRLILDALGVDDFGIYNLVGGAIAMLNFLNSAMAEASQRFMSISQGEGDINKQKKIFNVSMALHLVIGISMIIILEVLGYFLFKSVLEIPTVRIEEAKIIYHFMVASTFFTVIKVPFDAVLNAHENMFLVASLGIIQSIVKLGIAIYVTYTMYDRLIMYGALMTILGICLIIFSGIYCHKKYQEVKLNIAGGIDMPLFREMGSFASWTLLNHSAYVVTIQGTSIVLNSFFGVAINAAQGIANQVSNQVQEFSMTMFNALNPVIVKKEGEKNRAKMLEAAMFGNKISFFVLSFLSIPLIIEMPFIFNLWLNNVPDFAVIFCKLILIRMIIGTLTHSFYVAIGAIGDVKRMNIWDSIIFFSVIPISILAYQLGASEEAIYIVFLMTTLGNIYIRVYFLTKLGGLSLKVFFNNLVYRCFGSYFLSTVVSVLPLLFMENNFIRLFVVLTISSISFLFSAYLIGLNQDEKALIKAVAGSYLGKIKTEK